jgi:integrase
MPTLIETWETFLDERSISLSPTSLCTDYAQVTKWLKKCPIQDLTKGRQILTWILKQEPTLSARRVTMFVRSMYKWASAEDVAILPTNPVANFRMPKPPQKDHEIVVIPRNEVSLILAALEAKKHHKKINWSLYAEFMLQTAMRTGEVRALKWKDIQDGKVVVHSNYTLTHGHKNSTKTNKQRKVPLNARAKEILDEMRKIVSDSPNDYIFPWNRYSFQSFFRDKIDELHNAGLVKERYRPYDLRHVAISRWLEAGIPVTQAAQWAGNTSEVIWKHYAGVTQDFEMPVL